MLTSTKKKTSELALPREKSTAVAPVLPSAAGLGVGLPVGLDGVALGALLALPLLLAVLPAEVLLYAGEVSESPRRVVVNAALFGANINPLLRFFAASLFELPWKIVSSPM